MFNEWSTYQIAELSDVLEEASSNPVIYHCMRRWQLGEIDLDTALMTCVVALSASQKQLQQMITDLLNRTGRIN